MESRKSDGSLTEERRLSPSIGAWSVVWATLVHVVFEILFQTMRLGAFCLTRQSWRQKMAARIEAKALPHACTMPITVTQDYGDAKCQ